MLPGYFDRAAQIELIGALKMAVAEAPFFTPVMPRTGKPFSVRMTNLGPLGWVSDQEGGYRYQATHPVTGRLGGHERSAATKSLKLASGDVVVLGGDARLAFHGVDRIYPGTSTLLSEWFPEGGRINLTLRRVSQPEERPG